MELIVDANILFAALIKDSKTAHLLLHNSLILYTPEFVLEEFARYKKEILRKTKRSNTDFSDFFSILENRLHVLSKEEVAKQISKAKDISPDPKDVPYFACALYKKCSLWSNDKALKNQDVVTVLATHELVNLL
ncbi:MAG: PIN domain-containing protein [Candidatus Woesearchaeota archaeon]